jgi:hypothetical protein
VINNYLKKWETYENYIQIIGKQQINKNKNIIVISMLTIDITKKLIITNVLDF